MAVNKTLPTDAAVQACLDQRANPQQQADGQVLMALMQRITSEGARMWGPSIIGHGEYRYTYESGRSGTAPLAAFAVRGRELVLYLCPDWDVAAPLLAKLGPHKMGKGCLYFKKLADLDAQVLEQLLRASVAELRQRHG